ncbi:hypothetical protein CSHISOI_10639 [Colletotrichum shisoi]|uniref:Uncharacterized protein n=1 Tax=Colletotrichum shisoi TaxID=2078593 RepID=A0A5Q4BCZ2_9PEZI|nr:hypothetical protein CSHISOI_10639 [Colletotrichum shisoi]
MRHTRVTPGHDDHEHKYKRKREHDGNDDSHVHVIIVGCKDWSSLDSDAVHGSTTDFVSGNGSSSLQPSLLPQEQDQPSQDKDFKAEFAEIGERYRDATGRWQTAYRQIMDIEEELSEIDRLAEALRAAWSEASSHGTPIGGGGSSGSSTVERGLVDGGGRRLRRRCNIPIDLDILQGVDKA